LSHRERAVKIAVAVKIAERHVRRTSDHLDAVDELEIDSHIQALKKWMTIAIDVVNALTHTRHDHRSDDRSKADARYPHAESLHEQQPIQKTPGRLLDQSPGIFEMSLASARPGGSLQDGDGRQVARTAVSYH
jgi:hypothetical protein